MILGPKSHAPVTVTDTATINLTISDSQVLSADVIAGGVDHGSLAGLTDDDHSQYALLAGRAGGQTLIGGTASGEDLTLSSTAHTTKGSVFIGSSSLFEFNETTGQLALPTTGSGGGVVIGGDTLMYRSATQRLLISDTELHTTRSFGTTDGLVRALNIDTSVSGGTGTDLRALTFNVVGTGTATISGLSAITGDVWVSGTAGATNAAAIASANLRVNNAMTVGSGYGYRVIPLMTGAGTMGTWRGFEARTPTRSSTGTITTSIGLDVQSMGIAAGTAAYGIQIQAQSGSATNIGLYFPGTTANVASGIRFNDVDMYRSAANILSLGPGDSLTITAANLITDTTTGMKIGTATTQKLGFFNSTPIVQPGTYTITAAPAVSTALNADANGGDYTGIDNSQVGTVYAAVADLNNLRADVSSTAAVLRQLIKHLGDTAGLGLVNETGY